MADSPDLQRRKDLRARGFALVARAQIVEQLIVVTQDRRHSKGTIEWAYDELGRLVGEENAASDGHP